MDSQKRIFEALAEELLMAWQAAHGVKTGKVSALIGPRKLVILIEEAFSQAERTLAEGQAGKSLLQQYTLELLTQICSDVKSRIETSTGKKILVSDVNASFEVDQVMFIFKFASRESTGE